MRENSGSQQHRMVSRQQYFMHSSKWRACSLIVLSVVAVLGTLEVTLLTGTTESNSCLISNTPSAFPDPPTNLSASADVLNQDVVMRLAWTDTSSGDACFVVERKLWTDSEYLVIGTVAPGTTECLDSDLPDEGGVSYRIYASEGDSRSAYSNEAQNVIPIPEAGIGSSSVTPTQTAPSCNTLPSNSPTPTPSNSFNPSLTPGPTPAGIGDVNCDGEVDTLDVLRLLEYVAGVSHAPNC